MLVHKELTIIKPLQIKSLRQLVLISFCISLVPLIALLSRSYKDFNDVSQTTKANTVQFVSITAELQALLSTGQDLQRLIRQYQILRDEQLKEIVDALLNKFEIQLIMVCKLGEELDECKVLRDSLPSLTNYPAFNDTLIVDAYLARLDNRLKTLQQQVNRFVDNKVTEQQQYLTEIQQRQAWLTSILVITSLLLLGFSAQFIAKPVRKLQDIIQAIANSKEKLPSPSTHAPRELLAVEKDLFWLNDRLAHLERHRLAMLRHASHELKTPLASIKEGCSILSEKLIGELNTNQEEVLRLLNDSTNRLSVLIERLLDYNALLQQAEPKLVNVNLAKLLKECASRYALILNQNEQDVVINVSDHLMVHADKELGDRVFDNLMSNAIAYGKLNSTITLDVTENIDSVSIFFKNMGKSIAKEIRPDLFEPFRRGDIKRNDKVIGAGLGLSIVADCIRLMQGEVEIIDVVDADVCFRITLQKGTVR
ncbi:MAG: HAMP domain-containing sensor histidine kinase [Pseudomonadota bacterium]